MSLQLERSRAVQQLISPLKTKLRSLLGIRRSFPRGHIQGPVAGLHLRMRAVPIQPRGPRPRN